jgi:hypothetical protein
MCQATHMRWLVTTPRSVDLAELREQIAAAGGALEDEEPTPLEEDEQVVTAEGPRDFAERIRRSTTAIAVYPDSDQQLY